jgi:hypothetical protein
VSRLKVTVALAAVLVIVAPTAAAAVTEPSRPLASTADGATAGRDYPGDPDAEARLVAAEERRLIDIRSTLGSAVATDVVLSRPFRLSTTGIPTIVLVGRGSPYTLEELAQIAPQSVQLQPDGSYLITEHLYVAAGATLKLAAREGMRVRLSSGPDGFATIVTDGGTLDFEGSAEFPVVIESWDGEDVDGITDDGRAYVRVHAGRGEFHNAQFDSLGFWSGVTGGLSLTGAVVPDPVAPVDADDITASESIEEEIPGAEALSEVQSLETLALGDDLEADAYTSALVQSVLVQRSAFGVFVTNADRVEIRDSHFDDNLVDGVVFHRDVSNSLVIGTSATGNGQDGFNLARATSSVVFDGLKALSNGRNGITIEGRPLVDGPSATGIPVTVYGDNEVRNSTADDNGRYGIEVVGGERISIVSNQVARNEMGIVVTSGAGAVTIRDNDVVGSANQGIALRDSGTDARVTQNRVVGASIGIFARDAGGSFTDNTIRDVTNHGLALVGATGASVVAGNVVAGSGPSAIDVHRTTGAAVRDNDLGDWKSTKPFWVVVRSVLQPLTVLWALIALVIVGSVLFVRRRHGEPRDPYADQAPLSSFTRGVVDRHELDRADHLVGAGSR